MLSMTETMQRIAYEIEAYIHPIIPLRTGRLERSYKYTFLEKNSDFVEMEVGYDAVDPKTGFMYADYVHEGINWKTGEPIHFNYGRQSLFLWSTLRNHKNEFFVMIEKDYMSLFMGANR